MDSLPNFDYFSQMHQANFEMLPIEVDFKQSTTQVADWLLRLLQLVSIGSRFWNGRRLLEHFWRSWKRRERERERDRKKKKSRTMMLSTGPTKSSRSCFALSSTQPWDSLKFELKTHNSVWFRWLQWYARLRCHFQHFNRNRTDFTN